MTFQRFKLKINSLDVAENIDTILEGLLSSCNAFENDKESGFIYEGLFTTENKDEIAAKLALYNGLNPELTIGWEEVENKNWLEMINQTFPAFEVEGFYVYGSHIKTPPPTNKHPILMDAGMAFGTGDHATTQGCLQMLWRLHQQAYEIKKIADIGTGTAILSIGAHHLWPNATLIGTEIDEGSVTVANENLAKNNISNAVQIYHTSGLEDPKIATEKPFDLVIANILAKPLIELADDIVNCLNKNGHIILSGLIQTQRNEVLESYTELGTTLKHEIINGNWVTLLLAK